MRFNSLLQFSKIFIKLADIRSNTFEWNYFEKLTGQNEIYDYAENNLELLDSGTSRGVFILNPKYVLKVALPENLNAGVAQNINEVSFAHNPLYKNLFAHISDHHPKFLWIKSELVRPTELNELLPLLGLKDPQDMMWWFGKFPTKQITKTPSHIVEQISKLVRSGKLGFDVMKSDSWGITSSGRPVLLDYGMTPETFKTHYKK